MAWVLHAHDAGVEHDAPPVVGAARALIAEALEAINAGRTCTAINDEHGIAALAVYSGTGPKPVSIRIGYVVPSRPELVKLMEDYGAREARVQQIHWLYDIPIRQE